MKKAYLGSRGMDIFWNHTIHTGFFVKLLPYWLFNLIAGLDSATNTVAFVTNISSFATRSSGLVVIFRLHFFMISIINYSQKLPSIATRIRF